MAGESAQLAAGTFYSGIALHTERPKAYVLSELVQSKPRDFPLHHHERDYFFLVIGGDYREGDSRRAHEFRAVSAGFNPRLVPHAGQAGRAGSRMFTVEFASEFVSDSGVSVPSDPVVDFGARDMVWTGLRLFQCFRQPTPAEPLSFESIACELLGALQSREQYLSDRSPIWFRRTLELLDSTVREGCSITRLAQEAGVHPVHLARVFRKTTGLSPGEYLQRLRADRACGLLLSSDMPLPEVAAECGYYDQSHMTKLLRRYARTTPKALRRLSPS